MASAAWHSAPDAGVLRALLRALRLLMRGGVRGLGEKGGAVCENRPCSGLALLGLLLRRLLCLLRHCSLLMGGDSA